LYCYIEILSFKNFMVILNMEYDGEEFSSLDCHDVLKKQKLDKVLNIKMYREEFQVLRHIGNSHIIEHQNKLNRINKIIEGLQAPPLIKKRFRIGVSSHGPTTL
jgi:hypothetical protein